MALHTMVSPIKIFNDWEIQLLVLSSFSIQLFLFFTGGLRRYQTNMFLRLSIWLAYLGADVIAVYALGYIERHADTESQTLRGAGDALTIFWAPFLIIHLGGQDTITAFSMEDNNLWLRHLLNLFVQVSLALYVFWKSIGRHSINLLLSGMLLFVTGTIKYGERICSLRSGSSEGLSDSTGDQYRRELPEFNMFLEPVEEEGQLDYSKTVILALRSMENLAVIFAGRHGFLDTDTRHEVHRALKLREICLAMMYDDLYTKALVLRTKVGIILRCVSQISMVVAFILFLTGDMQSHNRADITITYVLFIGAFCFEVCAVVILMASPWTWGWLKARKYDVLARISWLLFTSNLVGWPEKRPLWSTTVGQYNLRRWLLLSVEQQPWSFSQLSITATRKLGRLLRLREKKIFWMTKMLGVDYVKADKVVAFVSNWIKDLPDPRVRSPYSFESNVLLHRLSKDFGYTVVILHMVTERRLMSIQEDPLSAEDTEANGAADAAAATGSSTGDLLEVCRNMSRYMMYLMLAHPSMLPLARSATDIVDEWHEWPDRQSTAEEEFDATFKPGRDGLEEMKELWVRLLVYAGYKSQPALHLAPLAKGGELLSLVWLLLTRKGYRSTHPIAFRMEFGKNLDGDTLPTTQLL